MTTYVVLAADGGAWKELDRQRAHNARSAIQAALLARDPEKPRASSYIAVPERHWRPETPTVERVQRVIFGKTLAQADSDSE